MTGLRNCSDMCMSRIITVSFKYFDECDSCKFLYLFFCPKKVQFLSSRHWIEFVQDVQIGLVCVVLIQKIVQYYFNGWETCYVQTPMLSKW